MFSVDEVALTRTSYRNHGYQEEARIRQFYGADDDKITPGDGVASTS